MSETTHQTEELVSIQLPRFRTAFDGSPTCDGCQFCNPCGHPFPDLHRGTCLALKGATIQRRARDLSWEPHRECPLWQGEEAQDV